MRWAPRIGSIFLMLSFLECGPSRAAAQRPLYAGVSVERAWLSFPDAWASHFPDVAVPMPVLTVGGVLHADQRIEVSIALLVDRQTEHAGPRPDPSYPPLSVSVRAWPIQLSWVLGLPVDVADVHPFVKLGGDWLRVTDSYHSDTLNEDRVRSSLFGAHAQLGLETPLWPSVTGSVQGGCRILEKGADRPPFARHLSGWSVTVGFTIGR